MNPAFPFLTYYTFNLSHFPHCKPNTQQSLPTPLQIWHTGRRAVCISIYGTTNHTDTLKALKTYFLSFLPWMMWSYTVPLNTTFSASLNSFDIPYERILCLFIFLYLWVRQCYRSQILNQHSTHKADLLNLKVCVKYGQNMSHSDVTSWTSEPFLYRLWSERPILCCNTCAWRGERDSL